MKKTSILFLCMIALAAFAFWAPNADAFPGFSGCNDCHHNSNCGSCHGPQASGNRPGIALPGIAELHNDRGATSECIACHGAPDPNDVDNDGDNFTENQGDCNDGNSAVNPVAAENCNDGIDNDCNGLTDMADPDCAPQGPVCGDGNVDPGEDCDDSGASATCTANCTFVVVDPFCGDGIVDPDEDCDDGNNVDGDGCSAVCVVERIPGCGDSFLDPGEMCDDGNNVAGDGCRGNCTVERCGDGIVDPQEECDGGNSCAADCTIVNTVPQPPTGGGGNIPLPANHDDEEDDVMHARDKDEPFSSGCTACHGSDLTGGIAPSCFTCHGEEWDEEMPSVPVPDVPGDNDEEEEDDEIVNVPAPDEEEERDRPRRRGRRDRRSSDDD